MTAAPGAVAFSNPDPFAATDQDGSSRASGDEGITKTDDSEKAETKAEASDRNEFGTASDNDGTEPDKITKFTSKMKSAARKIHLHSIKTSSVSSKLFNPTQVRMSIHVQEGSDEKLDSSAKDMELLWRARDNRKGRNSIAVPQSAQPESLLQNLTSGLRRVGKTLVQMFTTFPYWDMAFWSGWAYTVGSAIFVISGAFSWGPIRFPGSEFPGEAKYGVPLCFFFGVLFYQLGAVMAYLEAVNDGSFHGSAMRRIMEDNEEENKKMLDEKLHSFFGHLKPHGRHNDDIEAKAKAPRRRRGGIDLGGEEGEFNPYATWRWWPTWHVLRTHHIYEIGYLACTIQLFGVTLYTITGIVVLPGILDSLNEWQTNAAYWIPQMVAAACFLIASIMFMLETQEEWYKPAPKLLGWWIGVWSIVGSVGFELSAGFGPTSQNHTWALYQSSLTSMWGSAAYLIGSFLQWYEAVDKNPEIMLGI